MKALQDEIDAKAAERHYWKTMRALLSSSDTKDVMAIFKKRFIAKADSYVELYDSTGPEDSLTIARCQEGRLLCKAVIDELDIKNCEKVIDKLDKEIKSLTEKRDFGRGSSVGFGALVRPDNAPRGAGNR